MAVFLGLSLEVRMLCVALLGLLVAGQINRGICRLAWSPRAIGPWSAPHPEAPGRHWTDRLPVIGWWGLRRESFLHGRAYWIRPLLLELLIPLGWVALYWWETQGYSSPEVIPPATALHAQFFSHVVLISFMVVATFIDLDEQMIPDEITVPGTLIAMVLASVLPFSALPVAQGSPLHLASPNAWPPALDGVKGLVIALACLGGWALALLPKTWWTRQGPTRALRFLIASMLRPRLLWCLFGMALVWILAIWNLGGDSWRGLLSALVGLAFGGALVWVVRIVAGVALGKEAMGFGDVTLMAMIGTYVGWQPSFIVFFIAPFAGILVAVGQWLSTRRNDLAYGPYLCLATVVLIVAWKPIWNGWGEATFSVGWLVPAVVLLCFVLMGLMLVVWRLLCWLLLRERMP